jgi:peptidoglycan/LPS O-acetylase OafA/YrhL
MTSMTTTANPGQHLPWLDGVRGIAVLVVLLHNLPYVDNIEPTTLTNLVRVVVGLGWVGVQLFFVLSGFLITGILLRTRKASNYFSSFYVRRILRIFPLYYFALFVGFVVLPRIGLIHGLSDHTQHQTWYWLYVSNWAGMSGRHVPSFDHFWSLAVEEQFYLAWPLVVFFLGDRRLLHLCLGLIVGAFFFRCAAYVAVQEPWWPYHCTLARIDALAIGAAAALLVRDPALSPRLAGRGRLLLLLGAIGAAACFVVARGFWWDHFWVFTLGQSSLVLICGGLFLIGTDGVSRLGGVIQRLFSRPGLRFFGRYSYAMYVLPYPVAKALGPWFEGAIKGLSPTRQLFYVTAFLVVGVLFAVVASQITWYLVEKPFLRLKDRFAVRSAEGPILAKPSEVSESP